MIHRSTTLFHRRTAGAILAAVIFIFALAGVSFAHPLGNFTTNHFVRIRVAPELVSLRFVVDMAEIPAVRELQIIDTDGDGRPSDEELTVYANHAASAFAEGLLLEIDGKPARLQLVSSYISLPPGAGGLQTLRIECDLEVAVIPAATHRLRFEDTNHRDRAGWREMVVTPASGITVFNSSVFGNSITDELKSYPEDLLAAPVNERVAEFSFTSGNVPAGANPLMTREGRPSGQARDRLAELIAVPEITPGIALLGLLVAAALGALHALSPGHGKTVVGAYLVGTRGTARHAAFLGLTVTITHTLGVFALGLVTLFASQYIMPERLFPILGLISGALVLAIGVGLFVSRLRAATGRSSHNHTHSHDHSHAHDHTHVYDHAHEHEHSHGEHSHHTHGDHSHHHHDDSALVHSHGGREHSHLPPGVDSSSVTWRSLLALGISGGLLPCPSALVVMLSAISLHRVGYGLVLVIAFSLGLAATLTAVGLLFVYARRLLARPFGSNRLLRFLPAASALVITCVGAVICYEALVQAGVTFTLPEGLLGMFAAPAAEPGAMSTASVLSLGLFFGLKHAVEADHVAAVTAIVSEKKSWLSSTLVGGLWGVGHTISLIVAGVMVLVLKIEISEKTAQVLEMGVAVMLIALGANAISKLLRGGKIHLHAHKHGDHLHLHPHLHAPSEEPLAQTHHGLRLKARPLLVGMVHGMAGSAALMLIVLTTIQSASVGLVYITVFGIGSIGGMMAMSALVGLPVQLTAKRFARANLAVRFFAGAISLGFGLFMVYEIGFVDGLFA
ncbi:MAG: sulfite exporter TauE/SafE family protein [Blastocatellia bacterium]|nr:sulfite exporter TauE/SafE family protein [Blastocatellia bacterium]